MDGIPSKINMFNTYRNGNRLFGISEEITLPDFEALSETLSGPGILGEIDCPTIGHFGSQEMEIPYRVIDEEIFDMVNPGETVDLTLRGSIQMETNEGVAFKGMRVVIRGKVKSISGGKVKQGAGTGSNIKLELIYILIEINSKPMVELDKLNSVFKIKGVDILEKARALC